MRESTFWFVLKIVVGEPESVMDEVRQRLTKIEGVNDFEFSVVSGTIEVGVKVAFSNADYAAKGHRKIMKSLMSYKEVEILQIRTMISDLT